MASETRERVPLTCPPLLPVPPVGYHGHRPRALAPTAGARRGHGVPGAEAGGGGHDDDGGGGVPLSSHVSQQSVNFYLTSIRFL